MSHLSRRDFLGSALVASAFVAGGFPARALGTGVRTPANVLVSPDGSTGPDEPCLAVNPRDPRNLLAASELSTPPTIATYVSFDGGLTWCSGGALPLPASASGGGNVSAAFDGAGRGFVCSLLIAADSSKGAARSVAVWRTTDGGRTFSAPVAVAGYGGLDRPWLDIEPQWPWTIHVAWSEGSSSAGLTTDLLYARSFDAGRTFETPRTLASDPTGLGNPMVACGPTGLISINYSTGSGALENDPDEPATVTVVCSQDGGQTFAAPAPLGLGVNLLSFPDSPAFSSSLPAIAADAKSGLVCTAFSVHQTGADHADVLLSASADGGRSWSPTMAVTPQDQVIYFEPEVGIDDSGRIGVMAYAMEQGLINVVMMISEPRSLRFGAPITVTDQPFNPAVVANPRGRWSLGDYQALAVARDGFHPLWSDTRNGQLQLFTAAVRR